MKKPQINIVGGGLAGLSAAYTLLKHGGTNVTLYEARSMVGGRVQSRMVHERNIDFGGFLIYPWYTQCNALIHELGIDTALVKTPLSDIYYFLDDSGVALTENDVPLSVADGLMLWSKSFLKILQTSSLAEPDLLLFGGTTISEYLQLTLGTEGHAGLYETFFDTVGQGYCYGPIDQAKTAFMAPIVRQMKFYGDIRSTSFFPQGSQTLVDHLVREITALGGTIHTNTPITGIDGTVLQSKKQHFESDAIIFAQTASSDLYGSILPNVPTECWYTHFVTVAVELAATPVVGNTKNWGAAFYAPKPEMSAQAVSIMNSSSLYGAELDGCIVMNIVLRNQKASTITPKKISDLVRSELYRLFPNIHNERIVDSVHWTETMPVSQETFVQAVRDANGKNGYYFAGDFLGAPSMETAITTGQNAAKELIATLQISA